MVTRAVQRARRLWEAISEPRHLKVFYLAVYLVTVGVGIATLIIPPSSIEGPLGPLLTRFWAGLLAVGGLAAAAAVLPGWWWVERAAMWLILTGSGIYASIVVYLQAVAPPGSSRWTQLGFITLAAAVFILRLILTRRWDYEPRRG